MTAFRRVFAGILAIVGAASVFLAAASATQAAGFGQLMARAANVQPYVPGEVLVKFKPGVSSESRAQSISSLGAQQFGSLGQPGWVRLKLPSGFTAEQAIAAYNSDPNVEIAQPNYIYHIAAGPNDPDYSQQWALKNTGQTVSSTLTQPGDSLYATNNPGTSGDDMDTEPAWLLESDCSSVTVAVVDTGVNYNQNDLAANMWNGGPTYPNHGWNYVNGNNDPMDLNGHGTHVAGIIGAVGNNGVGTAGVCWKASIMAVRVLDATGSGTTATITQGVNFAVANGAKVINMSLGGSAYDPLFNSAISAAQTAHVVVVVAAGNSAANNDSGSAPTYPCNFTQPNLICVAALDQSYQLATFSNYGTTSVDVGAPGTNILSTWAGTNSLITDGLTTGWTFSTTTSGGWQYGSVSSYASLLDPANYPNGQYNNSTDDRAYKTFPVGSANVATLTYYAAANVVSGDHFRVNYLAASGDPFAGGGTNLLDVATGAATYPYAYLAQFDISGCVNSNCTIGYQLQSDTSGTSMGLWITGFSIDTLSLNNGSNNTISGTSMATPHVAGLAALVWAYNPLYTYADVVSAVKNGGRSVAALAGKTTTGKAVDALGSLAYINPPTGVSALVQ